MTLWIRLLGCADDEPAKKDPVDTDDTVTDPTGTATDGLVDALVLEGRLDYHYDFTARDEAQGKLDCDHAREYVGTAVPGAASTVCGDVECDQVFFGWTVVPEENRACYRQVFPGGSITQPEVWASGPGGFIRYTIPVFGLFTALPSDAVPEQGAVVTGSTVAQGYYVGSQDPVNYEYSFTFTYDTAPDVVAGDPEGEVAPYTCGWPDGGSRRSGPIVAGQPLPDHVLLDQCGQPVHLGDFEGGWTLLLLASTSCDTCRLAASGVRDLLADHPDLTVITLFSGTDDEYDAWLSDYHPSGPLLRDDGFGRVLGWPLTGSAEFAWVLLDPDQASFDARSQFTSWSELDPILP
jgi:hypothetical protein